MDAQEDLLNISQDDLSHDHTQAPIPHYDAHLIPTETAAREGSHFGHVNHSRADDKEHIHTRDGYTVDQEGLINSYAVEAPLHISEPDDLAAEEISITKKRAAEHKELSKDAEGNLSSSTNWQHEGAGVI